jgi:hypothetical protein
MPAGEKETFETGREPEYLVTNIARSEPLRGGMVRLYLACERGNMLKVEYTVVCTIEVLAEIGRACLQIAADAHNREIPPVSLENSVH